jgi:hypothetical protein
MTSLICFGLGIPAILFFVVVIILSVRKNPCGELPPMNMNQLYYNIDMQSRMRGWSTSINPYSGKVSITKGSLVGTEMFFVQLPDGKILMSYTPSSGALGWVLVIVLIGTVVGSLAIGIWLHVASGKFTREEVVPMITTGAGPIQVVRYN